LEYYHIVLLGRYKNRNGTNNAADDATATGNIGRNERQPGKGGGQYERQNEKNRCKKGRAKMKADRKADQVRIEAN
jgi:hypothetical protein